MAYPKEQRRLRHEPEHDPENRKDMVKAISELIVLPSAYMGMPSAAFQIGPITVNRDGTIDCEDETMIETIKPMLIEHGCWTPSRNRKPSLKPRMIPKRSQKTPNPSGFPDGYHDAD